MQFALGTKTNDLLWAAVQRNCRIVREADPWFALDQWSLTVFDPDGLDGWSVMCDGFSRCELQV